jgi:enamine deaminase RidA (YjgF/YER057c/UK114 family)
VQHIQPDALFPSERFGFTQVVTSPPGRLIFVSGQVAWDRECRLVGGDDLAAQAEKALENLGAALESAGAGPSDVTLVRAYIVDFRAELGARLAPVFRRFFGSPPPASTWVGVTGLAGPDFLVEVECIAVVAP